MFNLKPIQSLDATYIPTKIVLFNNRLLKVFLDCCISVYGLVLQSLNIMTVVYEGSFLKALFRWHGSVYKSIWKETLVWFLFYYFIRVIFNYMPDSYEDGIKKLVRQFNDYTKSIPLEFLLGFYVQQTVSRWWSQVY